mgnify:CR=1 FL=1
MDHTITEEGNLVVVALKGDIDLQYSPKARDVLLEAAGDAHGVVVDMSGVGMIDSSGVASLLEAFQTCRNRGKGFVLAAADEPVFRVLKLARLDTVFEIAEDLEKARKLLAEK